MKDAVDRLVDRFCAAFGWGLPDWNGNVVDFGVFSPGLAGVVRPVPWEGFVIEAAPGLRGEELRFAFTVDRRLISGRRGLVKGSVPITTALADELEPPSCGVAIRFEDEFWAGAANHARVVELPRVRGNEIEVSRIDGKISTDVRGVRSRGRYPAIEALMTDDDGDVTVVAHRFVRTTWVADVFPL